MRTDYFGPCLLASALALLNVLTAGCTTTATPPVAPIPIPVGTPIGSGSPSTNHAVLSPIPVVRYDRYTLVEMVAEPAQRDLMQQIVEVRIPPTLNPTVGDAMNYVLLRSGYLLCDNVIGSLLYAMPLPAAHLHLGPLTLRDALQTLAGPAWDISVDDTFRHVCFEPHTAAPTLEVQP